MRDAGGGEEEVSRLEGHRLVSHPESPLTFDDHVALVPVVGLLRVGADRGIEPDFELAAVEGHEVTVFRELGGVFR